MNFFLVLSSIASIVLVVNSQCTSLRDAADEAGLTSLVDTLDSLSDLDGAQPMLDAINATEVVEEKVTFFAPTNEAFTEIEAVLDTLNETDILNVLLNHVVSGDRSSAEVLAAVNDASPSPAPLESFIGSTLLAALSGDDLLVNPEGTDINATVITVDVETCAGTLHVINMVLVPAADTVSTCVPLEEAAMDANLTILVELISDVAGLDEAAFLVEAMNSTVNTTQPVTLFAPTNEAFEAIFETGETMTPEELLFVLMNHVVAGNMSADDVVGAIEDAAPDAANLTTVIETTLEATMSGSDVFVTPFNTTINATVIMTDVATCAGMVHVVDMVLLPGVPEPPVLNITVPSTNPATPSPATPSPGTNTPVSKNSAYTPSALPSFAALLGAAILMM